MKLSKRLNAIYNLVPECNTLVDIGTDHGLLIIKTVMENKTKIAYGVDINQGPLDQAAENVKKYDLNDKIHLCLADGLVGFKAQADVFVLAGLGSETIWGIIEAYPFDENQTIIIQSNSKLTWLRKTLFKNGFSILNEKFLYDRKKPVFILVVKKINQAVSLEDIYLGPILKNQSNLDYFKYLEKRCVNLSEIVKSNDEYVDEYGIIKRYLTERSDIYE